MLNIEWGNDLCELARRMFRRLDGEGKVGAEEVFARRDLIAAANRVQLGWLKLEAMYRNASRHGKMVSTYCDYNIWGLIREDVENQSPR